MYSALSNNVIRPDDMNRSIPRTPFKQFLDTRSLVLPTELCLRAAKTVWIQACLSINHCEFGHWVIFFIFSAWLSFASQSWKKLGGEGGIHPFKCALCVLHQSARNVYGCEVCVYAWTGFICDGPSHTYSQLGKLVEQGTTLATC